MKSHLGISRGLSRGLRLGIGLMSPAAPPHASTSFAIHSSAMVRLSVSSARFPVFKQGCDVTGAIDFKNDRLWWLCFLNAIVQQINLMCDSLGICDGCEAACALVRAKGWKHSFVRVAACDRGTISNIFSVIS